MDVRRTSRMVLAVVLLILLLIIARISFVLFKRRGQKTRDPQRNQMYAGSRNRQSLGQNTPTIYVSPSNLPPPPKYEFLAPPSYEEVVGIHQPNLPHTTGHQCGQSPTIIPQQPITQPITAAIAANSSTSHPTSRSNDRRTSQPSQNCGVETRIDIKIDNTEVTNATH